MPLFHRRDCILIILGASILYFSSSLFSPFDPRRGHLGPPSFQETLSVDSLILDVGYADSFPETTVIAHAPGYTLFRNLYMANCTFFAVSQNPGNFPQRRMITSTGIIALNQPENIQRREPSDREFQIISPETAMARWGGDISRKERHRVWSIEGISVSNET